MGTASPRILADTVAYLEEADRLLRAIIAITVAQLLVRDIESDVVRELKIRAARHGHSAEEEHRRILREALRSQGPARSLKAHLLEMPDVGEDRDFERPEDRGRPVEL